MMAFAWAAALALRMTSCTRPFSRARLSLLAQMRSSETRSTLGAAMDDLERLQRRDAPRRELVAEDQRRSVDVRYKRVHAASSTSG